MTEKKMRKVEVDNLLNSIIEIKKAKDEITKEYNEQLEQLEKQVTLRNLSRWSTKNGMFKIVGTTNTSCDKDGLKDYIGVDTFNMFFTTTKGTRRCIDITK